MILIDFRTRVFCFASLWLLVIACQSGPPSSARTYQAKGRVISIPADRQSVVIQHEEIPGFMSSMTMTFPIKDPSLLNDLAPNDLVDFELTVTRTESWISRLEKTGHAEPLDASVTDTHASLKPVLAAGQQVPSFSLKNQEGQPVSLSDYRGKPVAMTFIFTRCPLPDYCPRFTRHFSVIQDQLSSRHPGQFHLLCITIDPEHDTPAVLKEYAGGFGASFDSWSWLTGSPEAIRDVAAPYGVRYWKEEETLTHTAACAVIDAKGTLYKLYRGNSWTPEEIVADITTLLTASSRVS